MGSDAKIYPFDYERYRTEVVPVAKHLLLTGEFVPWWAQALHDQAVYDGIDAYGDETTGPLAACSGLDLDRYCTYLGGDLQLQASRPNLYRAARDSGRVYDWSERACRSATCPMRPMCIFHADHKQDAVEDFNSALETAVAILCLGQGQFVGRSQSPFRYQRFLEHLRIAETDAIHGLLERLGRRGFVVGYRFANGSGIHGWLTPSETEELHEHLVWLPLPQCEPTFAAMKDRYRQFHERYPSLMSPTAPQVEREEINRHWRALSLSFVRTVATMAVNARLGLLWGNDLPISPASGG